MWSDNETNLDFIDYQHLVDGITSIINNDSLLPCSIGIFGDWGSGKSSLMKMIADSYSTDKDILTISFNGWLFEGYEDAKTVLMGRIVDEIIAQRKLVDKGLRLASQLLRKIDLMKIGGSAIKYGASYALMGPAGLAFTSSSDVMLKIKEADYEKYIKDKQDKVEGEENLRTNIQEFHHNFEELIKETKIKKILVLIDDLDRCSPDTVIGTLEAIKLFLFTRHTAFIIGADERLIKYAVRRRFPEIPGDNTEVGRDYLEKLIQFPIRIPPLNNLELATYINLLFASLFIDAGEFGIVREQILEKRRKDPFGFIFGLENADQFLNKVDENLRISLSVSARISSILGVGLNGNPRQSKRFLNTLLLRHEMARSKGEELKLRILAKLMLLEYFKSETFKTFYEIQAKNNGVIDGINILEDLASGSITSNDKTALASLTNELQILLKDPWIKGWLSSEPSLTEENLQPYFYFSRDKLNVTGIGLQRMSPQAQEIFRKIISDSEIVRNAAFRDASKINHSEAASIFEALAERIYQLDNHAGEAPILKRLFDFCEKRSELLSQLIGFCEKFPEGLLPISAPTWLLASTQDTEFEAAAKKVVKKWSQNTTNKKLSSISKGKLNIKQP